ncbi:MAG: polysaccharide deacetylase family protein [Actinomycetes bacterium]
MPTDPAGQPGRPMRRRDLLLGGSAALLAGCATGAPSGTRSTTRVATQPTTAIASPTGPRTPAPAPQPSAAVMAAGVGFNGSGDVLHGSRSVPDVALTFHGAGAAPVTRQVLAELAAAGAHVTVFAVGSWLEQEPALATAILDRGHELGNHTYRHLPMRTLRPGQAVSEVARAAAVLARLTGSRDAWFRPSGTPYSTPTIRDAAHRCGYQVCVSYDVDSLDWTDPGAAAVTSRVLAQARPGSIVSLHLGHPGTAQALPAILSGLAGHALRPVTVTRLVTA